MLSLGVLLSSIVWDAIYISLGIIFGTTVAIKPAYMFLAALAGVTVIYLVTFIVRMLIRRARPVNNAVTHLPTLPTQDKIA
jgi:membrane protein DedA with SNARE-associated domain